MKRYGVVVVGCGKIGSQHLSDIYYREDIEIIGVVDTNINLAKESAEKYHAASYSSDYTVFLDDDRVDIFIIASYASTHLEIIKSCMEFNKHILCEKPVCNTRKQMKKLTRLIRHTDIKLLVGHILRFNHTYNYAARLIDEGVIGKPIVMRIVQNHHAVNWERYKRLLVDCSPLIDCGIHYFDIMQWFTGEKIVESKGTGMILGEDVPSNTYNYGLVTVNLSGGSTGFCEVGWCKTFAAENIKQFIGPKGRIKIIYKDDRLENKEEGDLLELYLNENSVYKHINLQSVYRPMYEQLKHLIRLIESDIDQTEYFNYLEQLYDSVFDIDDDIRLHLHLNDSQHVVLRSE